MTLRTCDTSPFATEATLGSNVQARPTRPLRRRGPRPTAHAAVGADEQLGYLRPRDLDRGLLAAAEQLAHLRARERHMVFGRVRAGLRRSHLPARAAADR